MSPRQWIRIILITITGLWFGCGDSSLRISARRTDAFPKLFPDIVGVTIPPNIAPLNFRVLNAQKDVIVRIIGDAGDTMTFRSSSPKIQFSERRWQTLLANNRGKTFEVQIYSRRGVNVWDAYDWFPVRVAAEPIDNTLVYREIGPVYMYWNKMRLVQRNIENFKTSTVLDNRELGTTCMNCHGFLRNSPDHMMMHIRKGPGTGMLLVDGDKVQKINTQTDFNAPAAFVSWHPSGNLIAFSVNQFKQFFHALGENRDVVDLTSDLIVYDLKKNMITTVPQIADPAWLETWPAWSADGKFLYFCRTPQPKDWNMPYSEIAKIKYDLVRIPYSASDGSWGEVETVVSGAKSGLSAAQPKASPDGRWILFCLSEQGNFTTFRPSSDLYLLDVQTGEYHKADCNSTQSESYHSWSSNSRWIVFGSKRRDGICQLPYFSYVDQDGNCAKPFLLPQKDPDFYETNLKNFHLPELITKPIPISESRFIKTAYDNAGMIQAELDPQVSIPSESKKLPEMWLPGEGKK